MCRGLLCARARWMRFGRVALAKSRSFHRIRHYGLLANPVRRANLAKIRTLLGVGSKLSPSQHDAAIVDRPTFICCHCGAPMLVIDILTRTVPIRARPKAAQR
uniref:hypothetical protein n=1 Tax=Caballeronia arvi TaxID=1777135 RepID=UPI000AEEF078|nr:hypothetical protein [Caballeronia arvi]